ncbi:MAG: T9SS type A sorting domain-containing protein [bacterium]
MRRFLSLLAEIMVLLPLFFFNVNATPPEECLLNTTFYSRAEFYNNDYPDSIYTKKYIDTCGIRLLWKDYDHHYSNEDYHNNFDTAYYYFNKGGIQTQMGDDWTRADFFYKRITEMKRIYTNSMFSLRFKYDPFSTAGKNLSQMDYFTTADVSSNYSELITELTQIEEKYGNMRFYLTNDLANSKLINWYEVYKNSSDNYNLTRVEVLFDNFINAYQFVQDIGYYSELISADFSSEFVHPHGGDVSHTQVNMAIYPNPVLNEVTVEQEDIINSITIFDYLGNIVYAKNNNVTNKITIDCKSFNNGAYFIKINNSQSKYFIIRR